MLSAKDKITTFVVVIFLFIKRDSKKGIRTRREKAKGFRKKTVRWTVFADGGNEQSEAREAIASEKSLALRHKKQSHPFGWFCFFIIKRDSNKEGESQRLSEENSPVDCFCRRWQRAKRGERGDSLGKIPCSPP